MKDINVGFMLVGGNHVTGIPSVQNGLITEMMKQDKHLNGMALLNNVFNLPIEQPFRIFDEMGINPRPFWSLLDNKIDIIHSFQPAFLNIHTKAKKILTIHDLSPMLFPDWYNGESGKREFDVDIRKSAEDADAIITVSEYTKKDVMKYFNIPDEKIHVVYNGLNTNIFDKPCLVDIKKKFGIDGEYILSVCTLMQNKNLGGLVKGYKLYRQHHKDSEVKLVLTGAQSNDGKLRDIVANLGKYKKDVIFTGFVSDEELGAIYRGALAFAYVSFYEGFGLPILEALSVGKPVICSNTSSMPEVAGDAAVYCTPSKIETIADAIEEVVENEKLRLQLEKNSKVQAAKFSYERAARETLEVYYNCLGR